MYSRHFKKGEIVRVVGFEGDRPVGFLREMDQYIGQRFRIHKRVTFHPISQSKYYLRLPDGGEVEYTPGYSISELYWEHGWLELANKSTDIFFEEW